MNSIVTFAIVMTILGALVFLCLVALVFIFQGGTFVTDFGDRFPPISEEEFVANCSPGTDPEIALKVRRIVADAYGIEYERVHPSMRFVEDIGA